jgi:hypothetical protein
MNAPVTTELVRPFMSYGKDERNIHKHGWELPIPLFDADNRVHRRLAELGKMAEQIVAQFRLDTNLHFAATRRHIREHLDATDEGQEINEVVFDLIA